MANGNRAWMPLHIGAYLADVLHVDDSKFDTSQDMGPVCRPHGKVIVQVRAANG